jgi:hypothetical protein
MWGSVRVLEWWLLKVLERWLLEVLEQWQFLEVLEWRWWLEVLWRVLERRVLERQILEPWRQVLEWWVERHTVGLHIGWYIHAWTGEVMLTWATSWSRIAGCQRRLERWWWWWYFNVTPPRMSNIRKSYNKP